MGHDVMSLTPWPYEPTFGGFYRRGAQRYVLDAVAHGGRCIVLQNFGRTIYFRKIEIEKYKKIQGDALAAKHTTKTNNFPCKQAGSPLLPAFFLVCFVPAATTSPTTAAEVHSA
jgi:hypothetical protein